MSTISKATVLAIKEYGFEVREYTLKLEKNYYFEAGSFLLLSLETREEISRWPDSRNFSFASAYSDTGIIRLIIRKVGAYTNRIFNELSVGTECTVKYAFGDFLLPFMDKKSPICAIAGGTGIAPILSFAEQLKQDGQENRLHIFYSFKNKTELFGTDILPFIPKENIHLFCTREEIDGTLHRRIQWNDVKEIGFDFGKAHFYICGGEEFTKEFVKNLQAENAENIYTDEW